MVIELNEEIVMTIIYFICYFYDSCNVVLSCYCEYHCSSKSDIVEPIEN